VAEAESQPESFVSRALTNMHELPWVAGVAWRTPQGDGATGTTSKFVTSQSFRELQLTFYTRWSLSPALLLHLKLLTQILGHFYEAKRREQLQRQNGYTQAIYDTGARLTHDVKNLLQSLKSLCAAAETTAAAEAESLNALIKRQLPQITQRLTTTLEKLKAPEQEVRTPMVAAAQWWTSLKSRHVAGDVVFEASGAVTGEIPGELFDSVAENLLANAAIKAQREAGTRISLRFEAANGGALTVCDTGSAIPREVAGRLLQAPVPSHTGLGIGLYQAALQTERLGYRLRLVSNQAGRVCFELARMGGN
jgi:signal transduction histidine kinase